MLLPIKLSLFAPTALMALLAVQPVKAEMTSEEVKKLALEAIMENPQIIMDAVALLREQEAAETEAAQAQAMLDNKELLTQDANAPVLGNPDGDVTIVEFFDYNCGYCKRAVPALQALLDEDPNIRLVYREFPILSEGSVVAARASLAARKQGKYDDFHWALMAARSLDQASVMQIAEQVGLDVEQLAVDMQADEIDEHLATSRELAAAMQFSGTPSFVIGDSIVPGFVPKEAMEEMIAEARAATQ
ncbi:hypothetical protein GCM10007939_21330 [Amylibacter marinus]|uniref:Thioredoxin domain-containing protein n=1 Tax=Amylibacter marinus TaxID=1475483 RepID=A0ABQ5VXB3_9RHOB|nr:DsbA family protein [Amylibacter marinus]GLQ35849.1 hypothetical protein GCM10007939_21330 [Amylibacter marinus]